MSEPEEDPEWRKAGFGSQDDYERAEALRPAVKWFIVALLVVLGWWVLDLLLARF